jgi:preprotein translocase subunit SecE
VARKDNGTDGMARINPTEFFRQVNQERKKVTWPSWKETWVTTAMVFVMVFLASIFFLVVDLILSTGVTFLLGLGK